MKYKVIETIIRNNNGYIKTSDVIDNNISKTYFLEYVRKNNLERVAHGVYRVEDAWDDELYIIQLRYSKAIFSHETAAYLLMLSDREPSNYSLTLKTGTNSSNLNREGLRVFKIKTELFELGMNEIDSPGGHKIRVYDEERTVCDYFRNRNTIDIQELQTVVKSYLQLETRNIQKLLEYAKLLSVEKVIRQYMEVLF
jgi:predicted transcriptional regulator of viral defense system